MCGVAGFLYRAPGRTGPIGQTIVRMLDVLGSRGVDGTGVALYGAPREEPALVLRVMLGGRRPAHAQAARVTDRLGRIATGQEAQVQPEYRRLGVGGNGGVSALAAALGHGGPRGQGL